MKELKADFQSKASKLHRKGRRSNQAQDELKQLDTDFGKVSQCSVALFQTSQLIGNLPFFFRSQSVDAMTKLNSEIGEALLSLNKKMGSALKEGEKNVTSTVSKAISKGEKDEKKVQTDLKDDAKKISFDIKNGTESIKANIEKGEKKMSKVSASMKKEQEKKKANGLKAMDKVCKDFKETDLQDVEDGFENFGKALETCELLKTGSK